MNRPYDLRRGMAIVTAGDRAVRVASARWGRDPRAAWHAITRAWALARISERRANIIVKRHVPRTAMN